MRELIHQIPPGYFATAVISWLLGCATVWRFAALFERVRDAVRHARHHVARGVEFWKEARNRIGELIVMGGIVSLIMVGVGTLVWMRIT